MCSADTGGKLGCSGAAICGLQRKIMFLLEVQCSVVIKFGVTEKKILAIAIKCAWAWTGADSQLPTGCYI
jgi:hypothetical protein